MNTTPKRLLVAGSAAAVALVAVIAVVLVNVTKQPTTADYKSLDIQRQVVDTSMNIYSPVFGDYSTDYSNVYAEERSGDDKTAVKSQYEDTLAKEQKVSTDRLKHMESSAALRKPAVKEAFERFSDKYGAIIDYYEQHTKNIAAITESVAGPCAVLSKLNVSATDYAAEYTKKADACLAALATAKKTSDGTTNKLLSEVDALIKERRDKFNEVAGKKDFELNIARLTALLSLLDINSEVKVIQSNYETTTKTEYTKLVNQANEANAAFDKVLNEYVVASGTKKGSEA